LSVAALCVAVAAYVEARREPSELTVETLRIRDRAGHKRMVIGVEREADNPSIVMLTPDGTVTAGFSGGGSDTHAGFLSLASHDRKETLDVFPMHGGGVLSVRRDGFQSFFDFSSGLRLPSPPATP
jgi:hypothetical protein